MQAVLIQVCIQASGEMFRKAFAAFYQTIINRMGNNKLHLHLDLHLVFCRLGLPIALAGD